MRKTPENRCVLHVYLHEPGGGSGYVAQLTEGLQGKIPTASIGIDATELRWAPWRWTKAIRETRQRVESSEVRFLHAHGVRAGLVALFVGIRLGRPVMCTVHGLHSVRRSPRRAVVALNRAVLGRMAAVMVLSGSDRSLIAELRLAPAARVHQIRPLFRIPQQLDKADARLHLQLPGPDVVAVWVGRLAPQKNPLSMIRTIERSSPRTHALMVGDGPLRDEVVRAAAASPAAERIHLAGWLPVADRAYAAADVFVSTARWEGLPLAGLEAAAAGLPLILSRAPGHEDLAELAPDVTLVDDETETGLALDLLADIPVEERDRKRARNRTEARSQLDPTAAIEDVLATYGSAGLL